MFKKAILLLLTLLSCIVAHSQKSCESSLSGRVTSADGTPLPGAAVVLNPGGHGQSTDSLGQFKFRDLCPATYKVVVTYIGYNGASARVQVNGEARRSFILQEAVTELEEIVIHHHDAENTEHATNYAELDERDLGEAAGKTLGETLLKVTGVTALQTGPGISKPMIHGVHSQRLLILNHGIRHEGQQWGAEHAPEIDPFVASNIVVIKDASAIKYGADALGGVIVVNPAALPESNEIGGTVTSVLQSNGFSGTLSAMIEGGIKRRKGWGWRVQQTLRRAGDYKAPDYSLTNTGIREHNFSVAAGYHERKLGIDLFVSSFQKEIGILRGAGIGNLDDLISAMERETPLYTSSFSYKLREPRQEVGHHLVKLSGHFERESGEWRFKYGLQVNNRKEFDLRIGDLSKIPAIDLRLTTHTADVEWETHHSERRTFSLGLNTMLQTNRNIPGTQRIPFIPNFDNFSAGLFGVSKVFLQDWIVDLGVRYDFRTYDVNGFDFKNARYTSALSFNNLSATVGVTHELTAEHKLNLNISTAWRPPHVSELFSLGTHQSVAAVEFGLLLDPQTNEVRDPQEVDFSIEQAVKMVAAYILKKEGLRVTVSPYANLIHDYIYLRPEGISRNLRGVFPYFRYQQTDALFLGVDMDGDVALHPNFMLSPRISLLRARDLNNDSYFLYVPSSRYSATLRYSPEGWASVRNPYAESVVQYVSRQVFSPRVITVAQIANAEKEGSDLFAEDASIFDFAEAPDGYTLVSISFGVSVKREKAQYDFRLSAENLLNQQYRDYTNRLRYYADEPGRNFILSVKCIF